MGGYDCNYFKSKNTAWALRANPDAVHAVPVDYGSQTCDNPSSGGASSDTGPSPGGSAPAPGPAAPGGSHGGRAPVPAPGVSTPGSQGTDGEEKGPSDDIAAGITGIVLGLLILLALAGRWYWQKRQQAVEAVEVGVKVKPAGRTTPVRGNSTVIQVAPVPRHAHSVVPCLS